MHGFTLCSMCGLRFSVWHYSLSPIMASLCVFSVCRVFSVWASLLCVGFTALLNIFHCFTLCSLCGLCYSFLLCVALQFPSPCSVCGLHYNFLLCVVLQFPLLQVPYSFRLCVALQFPSLQFPFLPSLQFPLLPSLQFPFLHGFLRYSFAVSFVVSFATVLQFRYSFAVSFVGSFATILQCPS